MEQELIRFVKFHGFLRACYFLTLACLSGPLMVEELGESLTEHPLAFEPTQIVAWLLSLVWSVQGVLLFIGMITGFPRIMKLLSFTSVGTFVFEFTVLLVWKSIDKLNLTIGIIYQAADILHSIYVLRTMEHIIAHLEEKLQEPVVINAIVCEGGGSAQSIQHSEQTRPLPVLYAIGSMGLDKKSGKVGSAAEMPQSDRNVSDFLKLFNRLFRYSVENNYQKECERQATMEQKLIRFVKFQGFLLVFKFYEFTFYSNSAFGNEHELTAYLLCWLWMLQAHFLHTFMIGRDLRAMRLIKYTTVGTFGLEAALLLVWNDMDSLELASWIIFLAFYALYALYVIRTLEKILKHF